MDIGCTSSAHESLSPKQSTFSAATGCSNADAGGQMDVGGKGEAPTDEERAPQQREEGWEGAGGTTPQATSMNRTRAKQVRERKW